MPYVNIKVLRGLLDEKQKAQLIAEVTDSVERVCAVPNPAFRDGIWVLLEEIQDGHWGVGGRQASPPKRD